MSISLGSLVYGRGYHREKDAKRLWKWQQSSGLQGQEFGQNLRCPRAPPHATREDVLGVASVSRHTHQSDSPGPPVTYVTLTGPNASLSRVYINKQNLR